MGTITSETMPYPTWWRPSRTAVTTTTSASSISTTRPSVAVESFEKAVEFAALLAPKVGRVRIAKVADEWVIEWSAYAYTYPMYPQPTYPTYPYITYSSKVD